MVCHTIRELNSEIYEQFTVQKKWNPSIFSPRRIRESLLLFFFSKNQIILKHRKRDHRYNMWFKLVTIYLTYRT